MSSGIWLATLRIGADDLDVPTNRFRGFVGRSIPSVAIVYDVVNSTFSRRPEPSLPTCVYNNVDDHSS